MPPLGLSFFACGTQGDGPPTSIKPTVPHVLANTVTYALAMYRMPSLLGLTYTTGPATSFHFSCHSRYTMGEISLGLISLLPPQKTFV